MNDAMRMDKQHTKEKNTGSRYVRGKVKGREINYPMINSQLCKVKVYAVLLSCSQVFSSLSRNCQTYF